MKDILGCEMVFVKGCLRWEVLSGDKPPDKVGFIGVGYTLVNSRDI